MAAGTRDNAPVSGGLFRPPLLRDSGGEGQGGEDARSSRGRRPYAANRAARRAVAAARCSELVA